jgi:hypothetical protein
MGTGTNIQASGEVVLGVDTSGSGPERAALGSETRAVDETAFAFSRCHLSRSPGRDRLGWRTMRGPGS